MHGAVAYAVVKRNITEKERSPSFEYPMREIERPANRVYGTIVPKLANFQVLNLGGLEDEPTHLQNTKKKKEQGSCACSLL